MSRGEHHASRKILVGLLLLAFFLRVWRLNNDPPPLTILRDEAPWTDEGSIAYPVLDIIRHGGSCSDLILVGGRSLHQFALCCFFKAVGIGRFQGRLLSVLVGMLGLAALSHLGRACWPSVGEWIALLCGGVGFFYVAYDRALLTEGILVALLTVLTAFSLRLRTMWGGALVGVCLGLLAMGFKLHALALLPAFVGLYSLRSRHALFAFLLGVSSTIIVWQVMSMSTVSVAAIVHVPPRVVDDRLGLVEFPVAVLQSFMAGLPVYFFPHQLPLLLFALIEVVALLLSPWHWLRDVSAPLLVSAIWLPTSVVGASVFAYLPARYFHFASVPLLLLATAGVRRLWEGWAFVSAGHAVRLGVTLPVGFWLLFQVAPPLPSLGERARWFPLLGLLMPACVYWLTSRSDMGWKISGHVRHSLAVGLLVLQFLAQGGLYYAGVVCSRDDLPRIAAKLATMLPDDAVLVGRLGGTLALSGSPRGIPVFGKIGYGELLEFANDGPVWVVLLEGDEAQIVDEAWQFLVLTARFHVNYSQSSKAIRVYQVAIPSQDYLSSN